MENQKVKFKDQFRDPKIDKKSSLKFNMSKINKNIDLSKHDSNGFIPRMIHTESFDEHNDKSSPSEEDVKGISSFINKNKYVIGVSIIVIIVIIIAIFLWYNYRKKNNLNSNKNNDKLENFTPTANNQEYYEQPEYNQNKENKDNEINKNKTTNKNTRFSDSESDIELGQKNTIYNKPSNKQTNKQHIINNKLNSKNNTQNSSVQNNTDLKSPKRKDILEKTKESLNIVSKNYDKLDDDNELTINTDNTQKKVIESQKKPNINLVLNDEDNDSDDRENENIIKKRTNVLMFSNDESDNEEFYKPQ
jgi:hypothetical protein